MKKKIILCVTVSLMLLCMSFIYKAKTERKDCVLTINEVVTSNGSYADEDGEYPDWIELHYEGEEPLNLSEYYISDDKEDLFRWQFPDVVLENDSYIVVFASGKDKRESGGELHTNFKLDYMGESIYIVNSDGESVADLVIPDVPFANSYGKSETDYVVYEEPTPGKYNDGQKHFEVKETGEIIYSVESGSYEEAIWLELFTREQDAEIYYTLDGSIPTEESLKYEGNPLEIKDRSAEANRFTNIWMTPDDWEIPGSCEYSGELQYKATVVKTRLYFPKEKTWSEKVWTNTYLIGEDYTLPIVSLSVEEEDLFDEDTGIFVPGDAYEEYMRTSEHVSSDLKARIGNYTSDKKVSGYLEYFVDGKKVMENKVIMRNFGNVSRGQGLKSLTAYAWGSGNEGLFYYPVFGGTSTGLDGEPIYGFTSLRLRNFGNDWRRSKFRDALSQTLVKDLNMGVQGYQPAILLLNGEYFGLIEIRENRDDKFFEEHFGIREGNLEKIKFFDMREGAETSAEKEFEELLSYVQTYDFSIQEHYDYVESKLDIEQLIDYALIRLYLMDIDWENNNVDLFRSKEVVAGSKYEDGRWRVVLYDMDRAINYQDENNYAYSDENNYLMMIINKLLENEACKQRYIERFEELLTEYFEPSKAIALQQQYESQLLPEIEEDLARWDVVYTEEYIAAQADKGTAVDKYAKKTDVLYWLEKMEDLRTFFVERPEYAREYFYSSMK